MAEQTPPVDTKACSLCHGTFQLSSPSKWRNGEAYRYFLSLNVPRGGVVCITCRRDISRVLSDPNHTPRWIQPSRKTACCVDGCREVVFSSLLRSSIHINATFNDLGFKSTVSPIPNPIPLCKHHYHKVYRSLEPIQRQCITCSRNLRVESNSKLCPQPKIIQKHLEQHAGFEGTITNNDKVCYKCYKSHLRTIQEETPTSEDSDLLDLITTLSNSIPGSVQTVDDLVESSMTSVALAVAEELLEGNALLLPDVQDMFCHVATPLTQQLQEADTRLWLHARKTSYQRVLMITPDTDVSMIGLRLTSSRSKDIHK